MIRNNAIIAFLNDIQDSQISSSNGEMGAQMNEILAGINLMRPRLNHAAQRPAVSSTTQDMDIPIPLFPLGNRSGPAQVNEISSSNNLPV